MKKSKKNIVTKKISMKATSLFHIMSLLHEKRNSIEQRCRTNGRRGLIPANSFLSAVEFDHEERFSDHMQHRKLSLTQRFLYAISSNPISNVKSIDEENLVQLYPSKSSKEKTLRKKTVNTPTRKKTINSRY